VARAKRTDRTEARRRYRAEQAALAETEPAHEASAVPSTQKTGAKAPPPQRPSITASFRQAYRPLHLRDDLMALPQVVTNWGFLAAMGLTAALAIWYAVAYNDGMAALAGAPPTQEELEAVVGTNSIPYFIGSMAFAPPPAIGAFLIGFTAKRASWLGGLIYGVFTLAVLAVLLQTPSGTLVWTVQASSAESYFVNSAAFSPVGAALFASAAAWYRRFLDLANPNRAQQRNSKPQGRGSAKPKPAR
jgi:hypothetical protein